MIQVLEHLPMEDYHNSDALGRSDIVNLIKSPAHFQHSRRFPEGTTPAKELGSATHMAVLEPNKFEDKYVKAPQIRRGTNDWKKFVADNPFKEPIKEEDWAKIEGMREAIWSHPLASKLFSGGKPEVTYYWEEEFGGVPVKLKCRPDYSRTDCLPDLKTTEAVSDYMFQKQMIAYGFHIQAAHYLKGVEICTGVRPDHFFFVSVEKKGPFGVRIFELDQFTIERGMLERDQALRAYVDCMESEQWPSYKPEINRVSLPEWYYSQGVGDFA